MTRRINRRPTREIRTAGAIVLAGGLSLLLGSPGLGGGGDGAPNERPQAPATSPSGAGMQAAPAEIEAFYRARGGRLLWLRNGRVTSEALQLVDMLAGAASHGLDPARYQAPVLRAAINSLRSDRGDAAAADRGLSLAYVRFLQDLRRPRDLDGMVFIDPELKPPLPSANTLLTAAASSPSLGQHLIAAQRMNPLYEALRQGLAEYRARWAGLPEISISNGPQLSIGDCGARVAALRRRLGLADEGAAAERFDDQVAEALRRFQSAHGLSVRGRLDRETWQALNLGSQHYERLILANLERARLLPGGKGRSIVVDASGARLWLVHDGAIVDTMRVIVGKADMETPALAGLIRFSVFNPYWNVPPDLVRDGVAQRVLQNGVETVDREQLELLSGWGADAHVLAEQDVDWPAVAAGSQRLRVRQLPGPDNMMGKVKFMLPNRLGIYLHDTPNKGAFARQDRRLSSGCVRVEDAARLAAWLFGRDVSGEFGALPEQRIDLPAPVPVYISYFTVAPAKGGIRFQPDGYRRDDLFLARLREAGRAA